MFKELIPTNAQADIDAYFSNAIKGNTLICKALLEGYTRMGLQYQTYFDLFSEI